MTEAPLRKKMASDAMSRRGFLRWSAIVGTSAAAGKRVFGRLRKASGPAAARQETLLQSEPGAETMIRTGCPSHNCGGRCLLRVYVRDGTIVRIDGDDRPGDTPADPQLRACPRGRAYRRRTYRRPYDPVELLPRCRRIPV